jgi:uncharacterized protein (TIGR04206 family)
MDELPRARAVFRHRYTRAVDVRDPRPDRRFIAWLLAFAGLIYLVNATRWTQFVAGAAVALGAVVFLLLFSASARRG